MTHTTHLSDLAPAGLEHLPAPLGALVAQRPQAIALLVIVLVVATALMLLALGRGGGARRGTREQPADPWSRLRETAAGGEGGVPEVEQRSAVCEAARGVAEADLAQVWELDAAGELVVTETCGDAPREARVRLPERLRAQLGEQGSAPVRAPSREELVEAVRGPVLAATGALRVHVEPMTLGGRLAGCLVVGWREFARGPSQDARSVLALLAAHAAMIAERGELQRSARTDVLTGLPNRRAFDDVLAREMNRASRLTTPLTVALIDLDGFKQLNDTAGHQAGDAALRAAAGAWDGQLRSIDVIARYGGDEFAVLLPACGLDEAREALDRVRHATPLGLGCSIGVTAWRSGEAPADLLARADTALYASKRAGRDRTTALDAEGARAGSSPLGRPLPG